MKFFDLCVLGFISVVFISRFPSPLHNLKSDLVAKKRLTALSASCDLIGLLVACDYVALRVSSVGRKHLGWIAAEIACFVTLSVVLRPSCRAFPSKVLVKNPSQAQAVKAALSPR
jgi:hypothetical protein